MLLSARNLNNYIFPREGCEINKLLSKHRDDTLKR